MSDGPHRSLPMHRWWKKLAERADKDAYDVREVSDAIRLAVERDWRDMPDALIAALRNLFSNRQISLFGDQETSNLDVFRKLAVGCESLGTLLLDYAAYAIHEGKSLQDAVRNTLREWALRRVKQVEEHYHRQSTAVRANSVRARIYEGITQTPFGAMAEQTVNPRTTSVPRPSKQQGLDDGVRLNGSV